jgi:hypothetical protein
LNVVFKVTDMATSFDWIAISQEGQGCNYLVQIHEFTIDCPSAEQQYQCYKGQCMPTTTGVGKDTCDQICH